jgi:hypothetical protein
MLRSSVVEDDDFQHGHSLRMERERVFFERYELLTVSIDGGLEFNRNAVKESERTKHNIPYQYSTLFTTSTYRHSLTLVLSLELSNTAHAVT